MIFFLILLFDLPGSIRNVNYLLKKSRKSLPLKTGWKSNERAIVLH